MINEFDILMKREYKYKSMQRIKHKHDNAKHGMRFISILHNIQRKSKQSIWQRFIFIG